MTTWWKVPKRYVMADTRPLPVAAKGETAKFIVNERGRRDAKDTEWDSLHPTKEEAWATLIKRAEESVADGEEELQQRRDILVAIRSACPSESPSK